MTRVLFMDDDENRHRLFRQLMPHAQRKHVWTARGAIRALSTEGPFDVVFLDHDLHLSNGLIGIGNPGNGTQVALFIARQLPRSLYPHRIVIHSHNLLRAPRMEKILRPTGIPITVEEFPI